MKKTMKSKGVSLLEIIIALAILMIILIPISNMVLTSMKLENKSNDVQQANVLAQKVMEYIKQSPIFEVDFTSLDLEVLSENDDYTKLKSNSGGKTYYVKVYKVDDNDEFTAENVTPSNNGNNIWNGVLKNANFSITFDETSMKKLSSRGYDSNGQIPILNISYKTKDSILGLEYEFEQSGNKIAIDDIVKTKPTAVDSDAVVHIKLHNCFSNMFIDVANDHKKYIKLFVEKYVDGSNGKNTNIPKYTLFRKGKVKTYTRVRSNDDQIRNVNRIYKVVVEVYKDSDVENSQPIQRLEGYKHRH